MGFFCFLAVFCSAVNYFCKTPYLRYLKRFRIRLWHLLAFGLTLSWVRSLSHKNQSIDLQCKSMDWFLYDRNLRHERVKVICSRYIPNTPGLRPVTLLKKRLWQRGFPENFVKYLKTPFLQNTSGRLLLDIFLTLLV